jgi:UDP-GlcNAc:undecaprenyl-phosphate/decaprenyl-phosphate GlcNAc-1-phosphate transferase
METRIAPLAIAFLVTLSLILALRPIAREMGLIDVPGGHKRHAGPVPVIGGIAIFLGSVAAILAVQMANHVHTALFVASALMVFVGALDDRFNLAPYVRIVAHLAAAMTLVLATGYRVDTLGDLLGFGSIAFGSFGFLFTVVATIALINAFNMLDGLDGLAGGTAFVALVGLCVVFWGQGSTALLVCLALLGSTMAFLIFNLPARFNRPFLAFMGDAGSTLLGFVLAGLCLIAVQPAVAAATPVLILWLLPAPIVELFTSTFRRAATGLSPLKADRGHFHHRLLEADFSVRAIFMIYLGGSSVSAFAGIAMWRSGQSEALMFSLFLLFSVLWLLATHNAKRLAKYLPDALKRGELPSISLLRRTLDL